MPRTSVPPHAGGPVALWLSLVALALAALWFLSPGVPEPMDLGEPVVVEPLADPSGPHAIPSGSWAPCPPAAGRAQDPVCHVLPVYDDNWDDYWSDFTGPGWGTEWALD